MHAEDGNRGSEKHTGHFSRRNVDEGDAVALAVVMGTAVPILPPPLRAQDLKSRAVCRIEVVRLLQLLSPRIDPGPLHARSRGHLTCRAPQTSLKQRLMIECRYQETKGEREEGGQGAKIEI